MKNLLIIFNTIFLLFGNVLFSNIHYFHDHDHSHHFEYNECIDCITIDINNNYESDNNEVNFANSNSNEFLLKPTITIELNLSKKYLSRAPPIS